MAKNRHQNWKSREWKKMQENPVDSVEVLDGISMIESIMDTVLEPSDRKYPATIVEPHKEVKEENKVKRVERMIAKALTHNKPKIGVTRKNKSVSKTSLKIEKKLRSKNSRIAKKVSRPTGSKKRI